MSKRFILRRIIQVVSIVLFFYFIKKTGSFPVSEKIPLSIYFKLDGLLTISIMIATLNLSLIILPGILMIFLIMVIGNFFCFWFCPLGGMIDYSNNITLRKKWGLKTLSFVPLWVKKMGLWILIFVLLSALFSGIFGFAFLGFVFDPFVILGQAINGIRFWVIFLLTIIISSILIPRFWCNNICPLGKLYNLLSKKLRIKFRMKHE